MVVRPASRCRACLAVFAALGGVGGRGVVGVGVGVGVSVDVGVGVGVGVSVGVGPTAASSSSTVVLGRVGPPSATSVDGGRKVRSPGADP